MVSKVIAELEKAIYRDKELDAAFQAGARAMQEAAATTAAIHSQYPVTTDYDRGYRDARKSAAAAIRALDPASLVRGE